MQDGREIATSAEDKFKKGEERSSEAGIVQVRGVRGARNLSIRRRLLVKMEECMLREIALLGLANPIFRRNFYVKAS